MKSFLYTEDPSPEGLKTGKTRQPYLPDPGLVDAVNVALVLQKPLLLTGEPGTGKTTLAASVASQLKLDQPLRFQTKSTSIARDLFYYYDSLGHFHAAQTDKEEAPINPALYIKFQAVGQAIIRTIEPETVSKVVPDIKKMWPGFDFGSPRRSVVLIDEIDKAPRDFPNDILHEIEDLCFEVPELNGQRFAASIDPDLQPILIITSNSEKNLPDAFLRRCVYYHIPFPSEERLQKIVEAHHAKLVSPENPHVAAAIDLFARFRDPSAPIRKRPATAELLAWLQAIPEMSEISSIDGSNQDLNETVLRRTLPVIIKTFEDLQPAQTIINQWLSERTNSANEAALPISQRK